MRYTEYAELQIDLTNLNRKRANAVKGIDALQQYIREIDLEINNKQDRIRELIEGPKGEASDSM